MLHERIKLTSIPFSGDFTLIECTKNFYKTIWNSKIDGYCLPPDIVNNYSIVWISIKNNMFVFEIEKEKNNN